MTTVCINGRFFQKKQAKVSVFDHGFLYGDGFYHYLIVYNNKIFALPQQWQHFKYNAKILGIHLPWSLKTLERWMYRLIKQQHYPVGALRLTITRGQNDFDFSDTHAPTLVLTYKKSKPQQLIHRHGLTVQTLQAERCLPRVKMLGVTTMIMAYRHYTKADEVILVDHKGLVREGAESNIFAVKHNCLYTPHGEIYHGIVREIVFNLAQTHKFKLKEKNFNLSWFRKADEIFLTNFDGGISPVTSMNHRRIGQGQIGPVTDRLMRSYAEYVKNFSTPKHSLERKG